VSDDKKVYRKIYKGFVVFITVVIFFFIAFDVIDLIKSEQQLTFSSFISASSMIFILPVFYIVLISIPRQSKDLSAEQAHHDGDE
jgi:hypothetical protein